VKSLLGQIPPGHRDDAALLSPGHRFRRHAVVVGGPRLDLDEYERLAVFGDDVNFSNASPIAGGENCVPLPGEGLAGELFPANPEGNRRM